MYYFSVEFTKAQNLFSKYFHMQKKMSKESPELSKQPVKIFWRATFVSLWTHRWNSLWFLCRYQFDPTPKIQQSMTAIWNSLVSEPTKTIDKYLMEIVHELQTNLTSNQWRVRESCCGALQDLVRGRSLTGKENIFCFWEFRKR